MERLPLNKEGSISSYEKSLEIATQLLEQNKDELEAALDYESPENESLSEEEKKVIAFGHNSISHFAKKIDIRDAERFVGHGVIRKDLLGNLAAIITIMHDGIVKGSIAPFKKSGYMDAFTHGDYLLLSHADKSLLPDIGAIVINNRLYPLLKVLRAMFPEKNIIRANELPEYIKGELEAKKRV